MVITPLRDLDDDLKKVDKELLRVLSQHTGELYACASSLFSLGGKRLRPALALLIAKLFGPVPQSVINIAAAIEMIHGASLIHDDVIDGTTIRRGSPTLNAVKGNQFSVLLGDFLLCQALLSVSELGRVDLLQVISKSVADMTAGQILEAELQGNPEADENSYLKVIEGKTAALMAAGCELSARCSNASPSQIQAAHDLGYNIGLSFQIIDDILDIWGDANELGKPVGSDLQEKKYTLPFIVSYQSSSEDERQEIRGLLGNGHYKGEHLSYLIEWMERHQARSAANTKALCYTDAARQALARLPAGGARDDLSQLLEMMMKRQR